jgi:hypothetical protein
MEIIHLFVRLYVCFASECMNVLGIYGIGDYTEIETLHFLLDCV